MVRTLLIRGMLAGLLAFGVARMFGEPQVDRAIAFEDQLDKAEGEMPGMELVGREVQSTVGLFTGVVVHGSALGGLLALVVAFAYGRTGGPGPRAMAGLMAAAGFLALVLVSALKYPPNPPAIGDSDAITSWTGLCFLMILTSPAALALAVSVGRQLAPRLGAWNAALAAAGLFLVIVVVAQLLLPVIDEVPATFPADVLWRFRIVAFGIQAVLWTTIGLVFGVLSERSLTARTGFTESRAF